MNSASRVTATAVTLLAAGTLLSAATGPASAAPKCVSPVYTRTFYANTTFSGTPRKTDCDSAVDQDWGTHAPATGLPKDHFGVRWSVTRDFGSGGPFRLSVTGRDGIRVHLDGTREIDLWKNGSSPVRGSVDVTVPAGKHTLRVDYVNWTGSASVSFTYAPRTAATVDKVRPLAPAGASATYDQAAGRTRLTWTRNKEMDLAGYRVYRRLKGSTDWKRLGTTTAAEYSDAPPANGETYYYEVRARDRAGNESAGSTDRPVTTADRTPPAAPTGVTATDGGPGITVAWKPVPGAARYLVHRRWDYDGENPVVQVASVTGSSWLDTTAKEGLDYTYWVTAADPAGNRSPRSGPASVHRDDHAPSAPTGLTAATRAGTGVALSWRAPTTPVTSDLYVYRIYRDGEFVDEVRAAQTSYTDTSVRQSVSYAYTVTAVDSAHNESAPSAPVTGTAPATGLAPAAVTGLRGEMNGSDIELVWQRSTEEDVDHYEVFRGVLTDGVWQYERWGTVGQWWPDDPVPLYSHEIYDPQGETVRWAVAAVDTAGNSAFPDADFAYVTVTEPAGGA
ncbi:fibronectin type III domain-containing protein [Streptomyces collinus]|uniref:fibronectin type III domain-containing protein n=1 Tax=Streptomyces collinus TaxID=42684 RepID=UPI0029431AC6|nr:PA14 domain-containing protein [Streptomyces collinus]